MAVNHTLRLWHRRTEAFQKSSSSDQPAWTDRQGKVWPADVVLELLADLEDRLSSWGPEGPISSSEPKSANTDASTALPAGKANSVGQAGPESEQAGTRGRDEAGGAALGGDS